MEPLRLPEFATCVIVTAMRFQRKRWVIAGLITAVLIGMIAAAVALLWFRRQRGRPAGPLPTPLLVPEVPAPAGVFTYPLDPERFGPYIPHVSGPLPVDTRFDVQNPGLGGDGKCFVDRRGKKIPFERLWHAGEDWFAVDADGKVRGGAAAGESVHAIANGVVTWVQSLGTEGNVLIIEHHRNEEERVWSVYWHVADVRVALGEAVALGETVGVVHDRGFNSHLHWEIRTFGDASALFPLDAAGGRGTCNGYVMGVGYTWDDDPARAHPETWGYLPPSEFVAAHQ